MQPDSSGVAGQEWIRSRAHNIGTSVLHHDIASMMAGSNSRNASDGMFQVGVSDLVRSV